MQGDIIIKINGKNVARATRDSIVKIIKYVTLFFLKRNNNHHKNKFRSRQVIKTVVSFLFDFKWRYKIKSN